MAKLKRNRIVLFNFDKEAAQHQELAQLRQRKYNSIEEKLRKVNDEKVKHLMAQIYYANMKTDTSKLVDKIHLNQQSDHEEEKEENKCQLL